MMAAVRTLLEFDATDRELHLFDTDEGMTTNPTGFPDSGPKISGTEACTT